MKTQLITKDNQLFSKIFGNNIDEIDLVFSGLIVKQEAEISAKLIIYKNKYHRVANELALSFGFFEASNEQAASLILKEVDKIALEENYKHVIGPINGSTWFNYRLMDTHEEKPFLSEEVTPALYNNYLQENGFGVFKKYGSNIVKAQSFSHDVIDKKELELRNKNWKVRGVNKDDLEGEVRAIARFANKAFANNELFSPIKEEDFVAKYVPFINQISTEYVLIITDENDNIKAVNLAFENLLNDSKEVIIKTTAREPNCEVKGLGYYLGHKTAKLAYNNGKEHIIHAYIAENNDSSLAISVNAFKAKVYRKYSLYGKKIN